jgi:F0F1-type ATP synthase assembly protein I
MNRILGLSVLLLLGFLLVVLQIRKANHLTP